MGVDICTWRARIGCFSPRKFSVLINPSHFADYLNLANYTAGRSLLPYLGALWLAAYLGITRTALPVLLLLLIIAGIELNPGPTSVATATCGSCGLSTEDSENTLGCYFCAQPIHVQCVIENHVRKSGTNLKNSKSWFNDLLKQSSLFFLCDQCLPKCGIIAHTAHVDDETQTSEEEPLCTASSAVNADHLVNRPSSVLTADAGVNTDGNFYDDDGSCSVIFSGVPFCSVSSDKEHVNIVLRAIKARVRVVKCQRFGRRLGRRPQLLRVTLASQREADDVIACAVILREARDYVLQHVNISRDLSPAQVIALRNQRKAARLQQHIQQFMGKTFYRSRSTSSACHTALPLLSSTLSSRRSTATLAPAAPSVTRTSPLASAVLRAQASTSLVSAVGVIASSPLPVVSSAHPASPSAVPALFATSTTQHAPTSCACATSLSSVSSAPVTTFSGSSKPPASVQQQSNHRADAEQRAINDGFRLIDVHGDGACMFRAVCVSDKGTDSGHLSLRAATIDYLRANSSDFSQFQLVEGDPDERLSFSDYLHKISQPHQQVGEFALSAVANVLGKQINVYHANCPPRQYLPKGRDDLVAPSECVNVLYYDSNSSNNGHYMALSMSPGACVNIAVNSE
jgi:hypothetical protein